jgi:hypothetical protein
MAGAGEMRTFRLKKYVPDRPLFLSEMSRHGREPEVSGHIIGPSRIIEGGDRVRRRKISWDLSPSPDVIGYRVYWAVNERVSYHSEFADVGLVTAIVLPDDVPSFRRVTGQVEIGITAVSRSGNESDMGIVEAFFDFTRPGMPLHLRIETI